MKVTKIDHALAVFKAGIASIPVVGGPLAVFIGEYIPSATQRSRERALQMLALKLEKLSDRLDCETVNRDEFSELFKSCYFAIVKSHQEDKLRAATGLLANILLRPSDSAKVSYTELDHFARCLDSLSIGAYQVLGHLVDYYRDQPPNSQLRVFRISIDMFKQKTGFADSELLMGLLGELNSMNLVHLAGVPSVRESNYGNYPVELTQLGIKFIESIIKLGDELDDIT